MARSHGGDVWVWPVNPANWTQILSTANHCRTQGLYAVIRNKKETLWQNFKATCWKLLFSLSDVRCYWPFLRKHRYICWMLLSEPIKSFHFKSKQSSLEKTKQKKKKSRMSIRWNFIFSFFLFFFYTFHLEIMI